MPRNYILLLLLLKQTHILPLTRLSLCIFMKKLETLKGCILMCLLHKSMQLFDLQFESRR